MGNCHMETCEWQRGERWKGNGESVRGNGEWGKAGATGKMGGATGKLGWLEESLLIAIKQKGPPKTFV